MSRRSAIQALHSLARKPLTAAELREIIGRRGYVENAHRTTAMVRVVELDTTLALCLRRRMRHLKKSEYEALFVGETPLGSFSAKIKLGYALALYGPQTRDDLEMVREIRNAFAHAFAHCSKDIDFNTSQIAACCELLHACDILQNGDTPATEPYSRYVKTAVLIEMSLTGAAAGAFIGAEHAKRLP
jgi:hypothetical protein